MSQTKLLQLKTYPTNFLFREFFKFDVNYFHPIQLPTFPREFNLEPSELHKGLEKISNFAVSKYIIQDLTNINPTNIFKSIISTPSKLTKIILQARSNYLVRNV